MAELKVRVYKGGSTQPSTTVSIPAGILKIARNLVPNRAVAALREEGVDLEELVRLSENPSAYGRVVEVEDHEKNTRTVVSLE